MKQTLLTLIVILGFAAQALAESGGHHDTGVPTQVIMWQAINLGILLIAMFILLRKKVAQSFVNKKADYLAAAKKSQALRENAENELKEYEAQLQKLRATSADSVARAQAESVGTKKQIIQDAQEVAKRIQREAVETVVTETKRAEKQLRERLVDEAMKLARLEITNDIRNDDHQKLQKSFVDNMKAVN